MSQQDGKEKYFNALKTALLQKMVPILLRTTVSTQDDTSVVIDCWAKIINYIVDGVRLSFLQHAAKSNTIPNLVGQKASQTAAGGRGSWFEEEQHGILYGLLCCFSQWQARKKVSPHSLRQKVDIPL